MSKQLSKSALEVLTRYHTRYDPANLPLPPQVLSDGEAELLQAGLIERFDGEYPNIRYQLSAAGKEWKQQSNI